MRAKDAMLTVRLPAKVKEALAAAAQADMRSSGQMCVKLLVEGLKRQGYLQAGDGLEAAPTGPREP